MIIELDHVHRCALIHGPAQHLEVRAPHGQAWLIGQCKGPWTYAAWGSEIGIVHTAAPAVGMLELGQTGGARERAVLEKAAAAIQRADMPAARIRWEYRDADGVRALIPVGVYLPLQGDDADAPDAPRPSPEEAQGAGLIGWNLRCNRCGGYGASWRTGARAGWGPLALCGPHQRELSAEDARHHAALKTLRATCFEQPVLVA